MMIYTDKVCIISLGCPKNQVDAQRMLFLLKEAGFTLTDDPADADCAIVNTCGFLEDACKEAIEIIFDTAELKKAGSLKALLISGCMTQRYKDVIAKDIPEADGFLGTGSYDDIVTAVKNALYNKTGSSHTYFKPVSVPFSGKRILTAPSHTAYLKIAEGCDNHCSFCTIPEIRGRFQSYPADMLLEEAAELSAGGVTELCLVAQDTARYGEDIYGTSHFINLLERLCRIDGIHWIRFLYAYPNRITNELLSFMAGQRKMLPYLDIPIQHVSNPILNAMNRRDTHESLTALFTNIKKILPNAALRATVIVGFPGETDGHFEELCGFVEKMEFDRLGIFTYSKEKGTASYDMDNQVDEDVKNRRKEVLTQIWQGISEKRSKRLLGKTLTVLTEDFDGCTKLYYGRSYADAPDIDCKVFFTSDKKLTAGEYCPVTVTDFIDCDLIGECACESGLAGTDFP